MPSRPFATVRLLVAGTIIGASAGCGGSPDDQNANPAQADSAAPAAKAGENLAACSLLAPADVQAVIGVAVRDSLALQMTQGQGGGSLSQCNYASADNPAVVSVMLNHSPGGQFGAVARDGARGTLTESGVAVEDVAGLGEMAFWGGGQLHVFVNATWYVVVSAGDRQQAEALAQRALRGLD
jgi:hypothetical protein